MGYIRPEMTIALCHHKEAAKKITEWIKTLEKEDRKLFSNSGSVVNDYWTFVMWWDGSKEGWDSSNHADEIKDKFISFLKENKIYYGSLEMFGDDEENIFTQLYPTPDDGF